MHDPPDNCISSVQVRLIRSDAMAGEWLRWDVIKKVSKVFFSFLEEGFETDGCVSAHTRWCRHET